MAIYELSILERLDQDSIKSEEGTANEARVSIAELMSVLDVNILKHDYEVKRLLYKIQDEKYAGYDYYEFEVANSKAQIMCKVIDTLLSRWQDGHYNDIVLRHLCVKQLDPGEE